jgi:hypothetical protein
MRFRVISPVSVLGLAVLGGVLMSPGSVRAEDIRVTVIAILASTDKNAPVDKELTAVAAAIRQSNPEFIGFRCGRMTSLPIPIGKEESFPLVDDETATVAIMQGMDKKAMIRVKVKPPLLGEVTMCCCCNKFVPFMTPYDTKEKKERLFVAVMVNTCPGK